jgi:hypothetical protein
MATAVTIRPLVQARVVDLGSTGHPLSWYQAVRAAGYVGILLDCMTPGWDRDYAAALEAGLAVGVFQGYYVPDWATGPAGAAQRARDAVAQVEAVGYPKGALIWLDSESWGAVPTAACIAWINAWSQTIRQAGYVDGLYVGAGTPLTADELYQALLTEHYWKSCSQVPPVPQRGYQILQTCGVVVAGVHVDVDWVQADALGGQPLFVVPAAAPATAPDPVAALSQEVAALKAALTALQATAVTRQDLTAWLTQGVQHFTPGAS